MIGQIIAVVLIIILILAFIRWRRKGGTTSLIEETMSVVSRRPSSRYSMSSDGSDRSTNIYTGEVINSRPGSWDVYRRVRG